MYKRQALPATSAAIDVASSAADALALAERDARPSTVCVAGSLFLVGDVLRVVEGGDYACPIEKGAASMGCRF